jgi:hypothetical protein
MPLTVFDIKGVPGHRRKRIEAAVVVGPRSLIAELDARVYGNARVYGLQ